MPRIIQNPPGFDSKIDFCGEVSLEDKFDGWHQDAKYLRCKYLNASPEVKHFTIDDMIWIPARCVSDQIS